MISRIILFIATGFGTGFLPPFPGTYGTLVGMAVCIVLRVFGVSDLDYLLITLGIFFVGVYTSTKAEVMLKSKDSGRIVIDEVFGYLITMFMVPLTFWLVLISLFINRFMDIYKPAPARHIHVLRGGWGVMYDDLISGIYSNLVMRLIVIMVTLQPTQPS